MREPLSLGFMRFLYLGLAREDSLFKVTVSVLWVAGIKVSPLI
jgi:hypothetical protein